MTSRTLSSIALLSLVVACGGSDSGTDDGSSTGAGTGGSSSGGASGKGGSAIGGSSGKGGSAVAGSSGKGGAGNGGSAGVGGGAAGGGNAGVGGSSAGNGGKGGSATAGSSGSGGSATAGSAGVGGSAMAGSGGSATAGSGGSATAGSAGVGGSAMAGSGGSATAGSGGSGNAGSGGSGGGATTGQWVLGYYVGYQINDYPIAQIDWSGLTHIAFAPMLVNANGTLDLGFSDSNGTGPADAKALSAAAHAHGVKALLMLGGAGAGGNIAANATPAKVGALADTLLAGMDQLGYDGIDLDWEDSVNVDDLIALAQQLRAKRPGVVLSYPAGAINGNFQTVDPKMVTLAKSLDRFNVQTYYPSTAVAGQGWDSWFVAPLSGKTGATPIAIDDTLDRYATAGIPKDKLGMGMAFYAICYTGGITGPHQPTNGTTQQIVGGDNNYPLSRFFEANGTFDKSAAGEKKVDAASSVPYLSLAAAVNDAGCGASTRYISYDDETSILAKGAFSKSNGYGGIIVWTIQEGWLKPNAAGGRAQNALMQALKQGFL